MTQTAAARAAHPDPEALLDGLNEEQRLATTTISGPLLILAGAGSGKTRVLSRRAAYAAASGAVDPQRMLIVTFTDKAAGEMGRRIRDLGVHGAIAKTVHSFARLQLSWLWPQVHDGQPLPSLLTSKYGIVASGLRRIGEIVEPAEVVAEIEWAKSSLIAPDAYLARSAGRSTSVAPEVVAELYRSYEQRKRAMNRLDFDDLLLETTEILTRHPELARKVRARRSWISVDEYQDTNLLQQRLFDAWLGPDLDDFCVVGDPDQAIFGFAGGSPDYLNNFTRRFPHAKTVELQANYRSSPQIIDSANRLFSAADRSKRLTATEPAGDEPTLRAHADDTAELAATVERIEELHRDGTAYEGMAILFRLRAHLVPFEQALSSAGIPYRSVEPFFDRSEVRMAIDALSSPAAGDSLVATARATWEHQFGISLDVEADDGNARRDALAALMAMARRLASTDANAGPSDLQRHLLERAAEEAAAEEAAGGTGVELLTYHKAKGLEWDAVFLPHLEDGTLPDYRANTNARRAEEWRLLYVGITRARRQLAISWVSRRTGGNGRERTPSHSPFLVPLINHGPSADEIPFETLGRLLDPVASGSGRHPAASGRPKRSSFSLGGPREQRIKPDPPQHAKRIDPAQPPAAGAEVFHVNHGYGHWLNVGRDIARVRFAEGRVRQFQWPQVAVSSDLLLV